jgi:simple sugar transport system substrate-binding protein
MKVGFLYIGLASGAGWSYAHELARQEVQKFGTKIETIFVENVAENDAERVTRDRPPSAKVILAAAFCRRTAGRACPATFPRWLSNTPRRQDCLNLGIYDIRTYEGACLNGTMRGHLSKTQTIAAPPHPIPEIAQHQCLHPVRPGGEPQDPDLIRGQHPV